MAEMTKCEEILVLSRTYGGRIQMGVTLYLMGKIWLCRDGSVTRLYVPEAVDIFKTTGSRHLSEAEKTLYDIQNALQNTSLQGV
jgi:hypothetical protein